MDEQLKVVVIKLNEQMFACDIHQVNSIEQMMEITNVPNKAPFIEGIIHLRGEIVPIIKLKERLSFGETTFTDDTKILIVTIENVRVGFIVDEAVDVIDIDSSIIQHTPELASNFDNEVIKGVAKLEEELIILLQLNSLFTDEELVEMHTVQNASTTTTF